MKDIERRPNTIPEFALVRLRERCTRLGVTLVEHFQEDNQNAVEKVVIKHPMVGPREYTFYHTNSAEAFLNGVEQCNKTMQERFEHYQKSKDREMKEIEAKIYEKPHIKIHCTGQLFWIFQSLGGQGWGKVGDTGQFNVEVCLKQAAEMWPNGFVFCGLVKNGGSNENAGV